MADEELLPEDEVRPVESRADEVPAEDLDPIFPLGLPKGSVRALTALTILAGTAVLILQGREAFPSELSLSLILCLSYYFAARPAAGVFRERKTRGTPPLWLPRGSIRFLFILGYGGLIYFMLRKHSYDLGAVPRVHLTTMAVIGAFLLGSLLRPILDWMLRLTTERATFVVVLGHIRGLIALVVTLTYVLGVILDWVALPGETGKPLPEVFGLIFLAVVGFYFGNRN